MSEGLGRANRLGNDPNWPHASTACEGGAEHEWQPLSFVFEGQLLDKDGRVLIRQPDLDEGRVYCVCMKCHTHTYIVTEWAGFYLPSPEAERQEDADEAAWLAEHPEDDKGADKGAVIHEPEESERG